jgi:hypothetical protein
MHIVWLFSISIFKTIGKDMTEFISIIPPVYPRGWTAVIRAVYRSKTWRWR